MLGIVKHLLGIPHFHDSPVMHHRDPIADLADDAQIVRDEDIRQLEFGLQLLKQIEHAGLHGNIQRGDGFIGDDQRGAHDQRPGDADALALSAGEGVRDSDTCGPVVGRLFQASRRRARLRAVREPIRWISSGSATISPTVMRGFSELNGS